MSVDAAAVRTMPVLEPITESLVPIVCDILDKKLALVGEGGIYLWCKGCHREHLVSWEQYDALRAQAQSEPSTNRRGSVDSRADDGEFGPKTGQNPAK